MKKHIRSFGSQSFCGTPTNSELRDFALAELHEQCQRCKISILRRGYNLNALRVRFLNEKMSGVVS